MIKALLCASASLLPAAAPADCGLALALIVDVSGSIDAAEYDLQMQGLADAILDPTVRDALVAEQVALALIEWSAHSEQVVVVPWIAMGDDLAVQDFANTARIARREWRTSFTAVGSALAFTGKYFLQAPACDRRVIDVSGDGPSNDGPRTWVVRDALVAQGIIINGIAIEGSVVDMTEYYLLNVRGGPGSFVLTASSYADYPRAIRRKLINEVTRPGS